ncbi:MAG: type I secretion system permease/ATPase [Hyphomonas sp.]|uniref:type I secretion system permease/ATPase n=1 Tax=Hyphomonas sp. TaxID=87 RepID=UPI00352937DF
MQRKDHPNELRAALTSSRGVLWHLVAFSCFINLLMLTGPLYMLQVYDRVLTSQSIPTLTALTLLILVLYATYATLDWVRTGLLGSIASHFEDMLSERAAAASLQAALADAGKVSDKPLRDLRTLRRFIASPAVTAALDAPWSPLFFVVLFLLHPIFGLWALFGGAVLVTLGFLNQRLTDRQMRDAETMERISQARAQEMMQNAETIDAMGMESNLRARWKLSFDESDARMFASARKLGAFTSSTRATRLFLQSAILGIGAWLIIKSSGASASHGSLVAASILMGRAIAPIEQAVAQWRSIISAHEAWTSLSSYLSRAPVRPSPMELPPVKGHLSLQGGFAGPPGSKKPILRNLTFSLEPGDVLGVLGPSAAGKSTLARILTGVWPLMQGTIRLDNAELSQYSREALGRQIGYLPQQADLLSGTIRENISRHAPEADPEAVIEAARIAGCHDLILHLPEGYDTQVGQSGAYLSAGQRQRVGLARALYGNPALVVLDEPNSNLDAKGEEALQQAITSLRDRKATTVIIAHRPNAIVHCNKLIVIDDGEIKAFGPRDEVLAKVMPRTATQNVTAIHPRTEGKGNG